MLRGRGPQFVQDDYLPTNEPVGSWSADKHDVVRYYCDIFTKSMKGKWGKLVYIDLYAGSGYSRMRNSSKLIKGSPIHALELEQPFDKYIFCESNPVLLKALQTRAARDFPRLDVKCIPGDCDDTTAEVLKSIPSGTPAGKTLGVCFADPFDLGIRFKTLEVLAQTRLDLLCLLALEMDAKRNEQNYVTEGSTKIDAFIGSPSWRDEWEAARKNGTDFTSFIAATFGKAMQALGYLPTDPYTSKQVYRSRNVPLYRIALYSRSKLAFEFWKDTLHYASAQARLGDW